jgi:hypothetical protein
MRPNGQLAQRRLAFRQVQKAAAAAIGPEPVISTEQMNISTVGLRGTGVGRNWELRLVWGETVGTGCITP